MNKQKQVTKEFVEWLLLYGYIDEGYDGPELAYPFDELWDKFMAYQKNKNA